MLFNSNEFFSFFALFYAGYLLVRNRVRLRNVFIVVGSYVFYSSWDYRFTGLLLITSVADFLLARAIERAVVDRDRRAWLVMSMALNIGVLALFKYFDFFRESFASFLGLLGMRWHLDWPIWTIILPVGISFYTFQSMGYVIDVYRRVMPASRDFLEYQAFVSFFPQLVAGPIERARHMLPQFRRQLPIDAAQVKTGIWLIILGLFKKVVLADNLAPLVEISFRQPVVAAPVVISGSVAFALQVYCDFSGYSDIARGLARLLGFELMINFNQPYFAASLRDFWKRWHISLSYWLRDYLYISLGGSRRGEARTYLNLAVTMLICGLWHGASLTFLLWGLWHGLGLMANRYFSRHKPPRFFLPVFLSWLMTMLFVLYGWMLFRAESFDQILNLNRALIHFSAPDWLPSYLENLAAIALAWLLIEVMQWRAGGCDARVIGPRWSQALVPGAMLLVILVFWQAAASPFIYFQF